MRRTVNDVRFYLEKLNEVLKEMGKDYLYVLSLRYGYKAIDIYSSDGRIMRGTLRSGLTTGEAYDIAYSLFQVVYTLK